MTLNELRLAIDLLLEEHHNKLVVVYNKRDDMFYNVVDIGVTDYDEIELELNI